MNKRQKISQTPTNQPRSATIMMMVQCNAMSALVEEESSATVSSASAGVTTESYRYAHADGALQRDVVDQ